LHGKHIEHDDVSYPGFQESTVAVAPDPLASRSHLVRPWFLRINILFFPITEFHFFQFLTVFCLILETSFILIGFGVWMFELIFCHSLVPWFTAAGGMSFHITWHVGSAVGTT
jgi:hypothetical protein